MKESGGSGAGGGGLLKITFWHYFKVYILLQPIYAGEVSVVMVTEK